MIEDEIVKVIIDNLKDGEVWTLVVLLVFYVIKREVRQFRERKKLKIESGTNKKINHRIDRSLKVLTNKYSNHLSRDSAIMIFKLVFYNSHCSIMHDINGLYNDNISAREVKLSLENRISIVNDEKNMILKKFYYKDETLESYCDEDVFHTDFILAQVDTYSRINVFQLANKLKDYMNIQVNELIKKL